MYLKTVTAAVVFGIAGAAASAQTVSPGDAQLAALAGVPPGVYSTAQVIQLIEARRENELTQVRFILSQPGSAVSRSDFTPSSNASGLTLVEQVALSEALHENDMNTARYIVSGTIRKAVPNPASVVTPGEAQLAALVGVDPADYTLAELVAMQPSTTDF